MTAYVGIECDGCGKIAGRTTVTQANIGRVRQDARAMGWHKTRQTYTAVNGKEYGCAGDICPTCWNGGAR